MLPVQVEFPKFVADQLLTSDDLNQLFGYLDEQNRLTRTNLIGIGIVCGLHVQVGSAPVSISISRGCGVTSAGYLIAVETQTYTHYKPYKTDTPKIYNKFFKPDGSGNSIPMQVWQLRQAAVEPNLEELNDSFLANKVVLLFAELKEEDNKNCDPNSCDDKGINVTVSFLPMLVDKDDALLLLGTTGSGFGANTYTSLPEMRMKRWDVPNSNPVDTKDIFAAYFKLLDKPFIDRVEAALKNCYAIFGSVAAPEYTSNPFNNLSAKFSFLYNGTANLNQLLHLQYYYDLFGDLLQAYQEFRQTGTHLLNTCCPDSELFPRHLLLGEAVPAANTGQLPFRHYFIYSPLFDAQNTVAMLRSLFRRMVQMIDSFYLPAIEGINTRTDTFLRITPSLLSDAALSNKAIPCYYHVNQGTHPLYRQWNYRRTVLNDAHRNLSYHATQYNAADEFVRQPLLFDLEPYNFLRIEGIVGKPYTHVLSQVKQQVQQHRLPIDIIALSTDAGVKLQASLLNRINTSKDNMDMLCHFQDLESMYDSMRREILCTLCKELRYYYDFTFAIINAFFPKMSLAGEISQVKLFDTCGGDYVIKNKSLGMMIEFLYRRGFTDETLTLESFYNAFGINVVDADNDDIPDNLRGTAAVIYLALLNFFKMPLGIIRLADLLTDDLATLDVKEYCKAAALLGEYAKSIKSLFAMFLGSNNNQAEGATSLAVGTNPVGTLTTDTNVGSINRINTNVNAVAALSQGNSMLKLMAGLLTVEDLLDHLDKQIYHCKCAALLSLKQDYMKRYGIVSRLRLFGYYSRMHPGLQHKAGVPMGGTFIVVYHARPRQRLSINNAFGSINRRANTLSFAAANISSNVVGGLLVKEKKVFIAGIVINENNEPVANAEITLLQTGESTSSLANGEFKMIGSAVPYTLLIEAAGYEDAQVMRTDDDRQIVVNLKVAQGSTLDELQQGVVIADFYLPYRCCSDCPPIQYIVKEEQPAETPNKGPVANGGADQEIILPINTVTLNGSASTDPDGTITFFQWVKMSGPGDPAIATPNSAQTSVNDLEVGLYVFELSVTDDKGSIARDQVQVRVREAAPPPNQPPIADAGSDQTITISFVTTTRAILDGSNSKDPDGSIVAFKWQQVRGPQASIATENLPQTVVGFFEAGEHEFRLLVTDNAGLTDDDTVVITVLPPANRPPVANAGQDRTVTILPNNPVFLLDGTASADPEGSALSFQWKFEGGTTTPIINTPNTAQTMVAGVVPGEYKFSLTVTDDKNASATASVLITVVQRDVVVTRNCAPLGEIVSAFTKLPSQADDQLFDKFKEVFGSLEEVSGFFKRLRLLVNETTDKQLDFFTNPFGNGTVQELLFAWLNALQEIIINPDRKDIRPLALMLYRILVQLAMYIMCIQKADMDVADIKMGELFDRIARHIKQWVALQRRGIFSDDDIKQMKLIGEDVQAEINRIVANGEEDIKARYKKILDTILDLMNSFR